MHWIPTSTALRNPLSYLDPAGTCEVTGNDLAGGVAMVVNGAAKQCIKACYAAQSAANVANAEAARISTSRANVVFDWYQGYINGTVGEEIAEDAPLVFETYTEEQAAAKVNFMFGLPPGQLTGEFNTRGELQARRCWYSNLGEEIETLENKGTQLSGRASTLRAVGTGLAVIGVAVQTGAAVYQDYKNGAGVVVTATDGASTIVANAATIAAPPLAAADLVTGGAVTGGIHNALMTPNVVAKVALGRVSTVEADGIKVAYTRFAVGRWTWYAGEYWYDFFHGK